MPRRKQSNPQPVKLESEDGGAVVCEPGCLVLESDFLLSGALEFGDAEIMGLDRDTGLSVFSLSVEEDPSGTTDSTFPSFLYCKGCGQLLGDSPLGAGLDLGQGLDLGAGLYCLTCEEGLTSDPRQDVFGGGGGGASHLGAIAVTVDHGNGDHGFRKRRRNGGKTAAPDSASDSSPKAYACTLCAFVSRYSNHLKRHMRTHDGQKPYRCGVCPYASAQRVNLERHARTHTGEKPYRCPQCSYACSSLGNLRRHQRMHAAQERPQRREKEKKKARRKKGGVGEDEDAVVSDLTLRVTQASSGYLQSLGVLGSPSAPLPELLFPLCCRVCGLSLDEAHPLEGGKGEAEGEGDGGQVCRSCALELLGGDSPGGPPPCSPQRPPSPGGGALSSNISSGASSRRGSGRRPSGKLHRCPHCPFLSRYPNHLARHAHTHSGAKPHACAHCAYSSAHLDNLKRHARVHSGEKPYRCPACSYACGNLANLRRHERIHSGAKPFGCGVCGYACNQSMNLKRHMLRHSGEKPYACAQCGYTTGHWDNYKRHQRKHGVDTESWDKRAVALGAGLVGEGAGLEGEGPGEVQGEV
ncbi:zinc finger protein 513-like [Gadus macrocephalus]|uniref:zinc finger protein 513-like n=1 Tax=Gadus macrocephalus TaxID=80720 RepID=UPI0028CB7DF1|nr:zinc finger protein 513-like [Gadus macrocephalus]